jgi:hypothetical protein
MLKCEIEIEVHRLKRFEKGFFQVGSNRTFKEAPVVLLEPDTFPAKRVAKQHIPRQFLYRILRSHIPHTSLPRTVL